MNTTAPAECVYERWIWIELIGFDNTRPGVGVKDYLDNVGFFPRAISLLLTSPDLIHQHPGMETSADLPPDICSYFGHPKNSERERQVWTNHQLKELVDTFHSYGVKVFAATFTSFLQNTFHQEWAADHMEIFERRRNSELHPVIFPLKRFKDGTYYEDLMIPQLCRMLEDYGFDGWHAADGWGPARLPLSECDYSDDIFDQFIQASQLTIPENIALTCDDDAENSLLRADWIWNNHRRQWIDFYRDRWASFYVKKVAAVHAIGKEVVINSAWTRDPFEAIYRFGIDYRKIVASGIDGIVTESAAGASDMEAEVGGKVYLYNYTATLMLIKAYAPNAKLIFLHGISDTNEQWDLIHHAPTVLESEIFSLTGVYRQTGEGELQRSASGLVVCLGDAISSEEWHWLEKRWDQAFTSPRRVMGSTLLWSDDAFSEEINDFIANRKMITHRLATYLTEEGAPIQSAVRFEDLDQANGCLLILNSHNYSQAQLGRIMEYKKGPIIMLGRKAHELPKPDVEWAAPLEDQEIFCRVWGINDGIKTKLSNITLSNSLPERLDRDNITEPLSFLHYLPMQEASLDFIKACAKLISIVSSPFQVQSGEDYINIQVTEQPNGKYRIVIRNRQLAYRTPVIDVGSPIKSIDIITEFPVTQLVPDGSIFGVKVPGRGATVVEVELAS